MGNRSRRRRRTDGTISDARHEPPAVAVGDTRDPLYGIPDTNMPRLAGVRMARALQGRGGWRRWYAVASLVSLVLSAVVFWAAVVVTH